jgi:threonine/homoserine/homoserine lactone efflux protein
MVETYFLSANLLLAYSAYALGTASPGPSNLAVMATAMHAGRKSATIFALGVVSGSTLWGLLAAFGLSAAMSQYSQTLIVMKLLGGLYLLWLAFKSAKSAFSVHSTFVASPTTENESSAMLFMRGAAMHLTNPKAIFVWLSIVALALPADAKWSSALLVVVGCIPIGVFIFCGYALLFSTRSARQIYARSRRWFDGTLAVLFGYAGIRLLASTA